MKYIKTFELSTFVQKYIIKDFIVTKLTERENIDNTGSFGEVHNCSTDNLFILDFYFSELNNVDKENIKNVKSLLKGYYKTFYNKPIGQNDYRHQGDYEYRLRIIIENDKIDELHKHIGDTRHHASNK